MLYLLLNLLLANVYQGYKQILEDDLYEDEGAMKTSLGKAYLSLSPNNEGISPTTWKAFIKELCDPYIGQIQAGDPTNTEYNVNRAWTVMKKGCRKMKGFHEDEDNMEYPLFEELLKLMNARQLFIPSPKQVKKEETVMDSALLWIFEGGCEVFGMKIVWDRMIDFIILLDMPITLWASVSFAGTKTPENYSTS
jgi:hypothetical protein